MFLKKGKFAGVDGDSALVEYPPDGSEVLAQLLAKPEKKALIEQSLTEAFGRPMYLRTAVKGAAARPGSNAAGKKALDLAYETFPRDKIEILDE